MGRGYEAENRAGVSPARVAHDYQFLLLEKEIEWLRTLTHVVPAGIFRTDPRGRCTFVNEHWCEMAGFSSSQILGRAWEIAVHPEDVARLQAEWRRCFSSQEAFRVEHRYAAPNGRFVWALTRAVREVDGRGRTTGYTGMSTDITELQRIRKELERSHAALEDRMEHRAAELQRMARIVETIDDAVISTDLEGRVLTWNHGAELVFGYTAAEMLGQIVLSIAPEMRRAEALEIFQHIRGGGEIHRFETMSTTKEGKPIEISVSAFVLRDHHGDMRGLWAIVRDVTERKRATRRLRRLSWRLLRIQDEERRRLARELHDSTAQALAALSMNLSALAREEPALSAERRKQVLAESILLADQVTGDLRTTSCILHPPLLDERGLPAALQWLARGFSDRSGIKVKLEIAPEIGRMAEEVELTLFRVVQESLHNIHRHSGSKTADIRLTRENGEVILEVRDRGTGLPAQNSEAPGVGIIGMRERLLELGGTLVIEPVHPGTAVRARLTPAL